MEIKNAPRKTEEWEFQEILRKLAANSNPVSTIPEPEYPLIRSDSSSPKETHIPFK